MNRLITVAACVAALSAATLRAADNVDMQRRAEELKSLKWGMFVCWSFSTFSGKEWTPGVKDIAAFRATGCDTDQWARTAKEAGMGYILFLTKHHDGFCLWDTKTTGRKVTRAPLGRDVLAELRKSCDKYGIKLALYFSLGEFADNKDYHPGGYTPEMQYAQLKELCTEYGPIEFFWMDCAQGDGGHDRKDITAWVKRFQPGCYVGFNGGGAGDLRAGEMGHPGPVKGFLVGEFTYPILPDHSGGAQWFYSLPRHDGLCRSAKALYKDYRGAVKYGNIFSLDVGPDYAGKLRKIDVDTLQAVGEMIKHPLADSRPAPPKESWKRDVLKQPIRAFCIDFNWHNGRFAEPGHWADADPAAHVKWYKDLGANCIQTFVLSCNGYAWYKGGPIPPQPGLKSDFLPEVVRLGHQQHMLVLGYYCIDANTLWGRQHPEQSYGTPSTLHIPLTKEYVAYLSASVEDALKRTDIDGFMLDWLANTSGKWLDCEKTMYAELMGVPFPGADKVTAVDKATFDRRAVERCWISIRDAARKVKPDCILWPNGLHHAELDGVDWLLNEGPDARATEAAGQGLADEPVRLIQNEVGWPSHDARKVFCKAKYQTWDFYGFAEPYDHSLPLPVAEYLSRPVGDFKGRDPMTINDRNIAALARFYCGKPVEPPPRTNLAEGKPARASSTWSAGYEASQAFDGDDATRWGAAPGTRSGWIEVDLGKPLTVGRAVIKELGYHRTQRFAVEYKDGETWKPVVRGAVIGGEKAYSFPPVTAQVFRLNILKANEVPTIEEFELHPPAGSQ